MPCLDHVNKLKLRNDLFDFYKSKRTSVEIFRIKLLKGSHLDSERKIKILVEILTN